MMEPDHVKKVYAFILTVGEVLAVKGVVMYSLYADIWGTAFTDAALEALSAILLQDAGGASGMAVFAPGLYGMNISYIHQLFQILDGSAIGVEAHAHSGCMIPLKSYAGLMIAVDDISMLPPVDCMNCAGNRGGCRFCRRGVARNAPTSSTAH